MSFEKESLYLVLVALLFLSGSFFVLDRSLRAEESPGGASMKLLISEVYIGGESARDEFIELYNPNPYAVSLEGWSLKKRAKNGSSDYSNLSSDLGIVRDPVTGKKVEGSSTLSIPAQGYFLLVPRMVCTESGTGKCYTGKTEPDGYYSVKDASLAEDNSLTLSDPQKKESDKVGWGDAADFEGNAFVADNLTGQSLSRLIVSGQMQDTDDNSDDFISLTVPGPMNAKSSDVEADQVLPLEDEKDGAVDEKSGGVQASPASATAEKGKEPEEKTDVVISELLINPEGEDSKLEFIELYNRGGVEADLGGWILEDLSGKTGTYVFPAGIKLAGGGYRALYSDETKLSLNNDGDGAILKDASGEMVYETPLSGKAVEGIAFAWSGIDWIWTSEPTPDKANIIIKSAAGDEKIPEAPSVISQAETVIDEWADDNASGPVYDFSDAVIISEIFPDPSGRDNKEGNWEWIEFYNESAQAVNLKGWCVDDIPDKGSKTFCFSEDRMIPAYGFLLLYGDESRLALNNTEDEVNLIWPDKKIVDSVSYSKSKESYSYALSSDGRWSWSEKSTPGKTNIISRAAGTLTAAKAELSEENAVGAEEGGSVLAAEDVPAFDLETIVSITQAKADVSSMQVCVKGIVSAPVGILGEGISYISDKESGDGIQIATEGQSLAGFHLGDEISLCGISGDIGGEKRIMLGSGPVENLSSDNRIKVLSFDPSRENELLGALLMIDADIQEITSPGMIYIASGSGSVKVYAEPETGISFAGLTAGERISLTGIWSRTSEGYRLLPRYGSDIRSLKKLSGNDIILANGETATAGNQSSLRVWVLILSALAIVLLDRFRRKIRSLEKEKTTGRDDSNDNI